MEKRPRSPFEPNGLPWRAIAEEASDGLFVSDSELRVLWVNRRACELLGRELDQIVGHTISDFFWDAGDVVREPLHSGELGAGRMTLTQRVFRTKSGERRVLEVSARAVGEGLILGIARDATARIDALEHLRSSEAGFRALCESSPDGIVVHSGGATLYANSAIATMLGFESAAPLVAVRVIDHIHPEDRSKVLGRIKVLQGGEPTVPFSEERLIRRDGTALVASISGVNVVYEGRPAILAIVRDVTAQRAQLAQLAQAEKMASLGVLSAGVAHEVNNPLAYLTLRLNALAALGERVGQAVERTRSSLAARVGPAAAAEIIDADLGIDQFALLADHVATASEGAERVRAIVQDLRIFSRADGNEPRPLDVRLPLERALSMVGHRLEHGGQIVLEQSETPLVLASEGRLTQVFVNLLVNAGQAIAEAPPGPHEVRVRVAYEDGNVVVAIRDTGVGILSADIPRVFEPFFTTKPVGVGTGLGLSICHGIVASFGGTIRVDSQVGVGTTFTVAFPPLAHGQ